MHRYSAIALLLTACGSTGALDTTEDHATSPPSRLRTATNAVRDFSIAEKHAHETQLRLNEHRSLGEGIHVAKAANANAENVANDALVQAWTHYPALTSSTLLIEEPLQLAILDLQSELRRRLGPNNHTAVEGLIDDPGCAGDVVQARLLVRFADVAMTIPTHELGTSSHPAAEILNLMAHQVACLGARQLWELESAMARGFASVASRLRQRGFDDLIPAFARLVAPIQLLILDVRKARGSLSESQQWFATHQTGLLEAVERAGWPSGQVLVWDRRIGVLVAHDADLRTLLESLSDPRAIGTGRCGFSAMISRGAVHFAASNAGSAGKRYACPTSSCSAATAEPIRVEQQREIESLWGSLTNADLGEMQSICRGAGYDALGTLQDLTSCLDQEFASLFSNQNNPFDTFNECIIDGMSLSEVPGVSENGWLTGVPNGIGCELSDNAGPTETASAATPASHEQQAIKIPLPSGQTSFVYVSSDGSTYAAISGNYSEIKIGGKKVYIAQPCEDCSPRDEILNTIYYLSQQVALYEGAEDQWIVEDMLAIVAADNSGYAVTSDYDFNVKPLRGSYDCADPTACNNDCTAMGQMIAATEACTSDLLSAFAAATGRNTKELRPRRDIVSYPRPDDFASNGGDNLGTCFSSPGERSAPACGLVLCTNGSIAQSVGEECGCDTPTSYREAANNLCAQVRCTDGTQPHSITCECRDAGAILGTVPGRPPHPETTLEWCLLDSSDGHFAYDHGADPQT